MSDLTRTLYVGAVLGFTTCGLAAPIDDARTLLSKGDHLAVDQSLNVELNQPKPSVEALEVSLEAAMRSGRLITAEARIAALLKATENKNPALLLRGARIAVQLGEVSSAQSRYLTYVRLVDQRTDDLQEALHYVLTCEAHVDAYRRYVGHFGANDESWALGQRVLDRLINVPDPKGALEIARFLQESFPASDRVSHVHRVLHDAAESFTFGSEPVARFLPALETMLHGYPDSTGWIGRTYRALGNAVPPTERAEMLLAYHERFGKPVNADLVGHFDAIREIEDEATRLAAARRYLALEPIYADVNNKADYDRYLRVIFDGPQAFMVKDKQLVTTPVTKRFFETYKRHYDKARWSTPIHYVQLTLTDPQEKVALYRQNLAELSAGQVADLLRLTDSANLATVLQTNAAGKPFIHDVRLRWAVLERFNQVGDKNGLLSAVRDALLTHPTNFDANYLRTHFIGSRLPSAQEKIAVLKEFITQAGVTGPMRSILDGMAKEKATPGPWGNLKSFQELKSWADGKPAAANPALAALTALIEIPENANNPDARVLQTVKTFLEGYKGKIPGGDDQIKDIEAQQAREVYARHFSHTRNHRDGLGAWAQLWSARMPAGDFWRDMTEQLSRHQRRAELFDLALRYVDLTVKGGDDRRVWAALTGAAKDGQEVPAPFANAYARMGSDLALRYLLGNQGQFDADTRQALLDEMAKAVAAGGEITDQALAEEVIRRLAAWTHEPPLKYKPSAALVKAVDENYRKLAGDDASARVLASVHAIYQRNGYEPEAKANLQAFLDWANRKPAVEKANALCAMLDTGALPVESQDATEPKPGTWLHTMVKLYWPALQQTPAEQWALIEVDQHPIDRLHEILRTENHPLRPDAQALSMRVVDMVEAGARFDGSKASLLPALSIAAGERIAADDWVAFNRLAGLIADFLAAEGNAGHLFQQHVQTMLPILEEKKDATEPLYALLWRIERRVRGQEAFVQQLQITKARVATGIANLIPVPPHHPLYDLYQAAAALSVGQETRAWTLIASPARQKLLMDNWMVFDERFVAWYIDQLRKQKGDALPQTVQLCFTVLLQEARLDPEVAARILLTRGDSYRDLQNYALARAEYEGLRNNDRYRSTPAGLRATYRLVELHVRTRNYGDAEAMLQRMVDADDINTQAEAYYLRARIEYQQENYAAAMDHVRQAKERVAGHVEAALLEGELKLHVRGGMDNPIVEIGMEQLQTILVPGRPLILKLHDHNLSVARAGAAIPVIVRTSVGGDKEHINLLPSSSNRNLFQATIPTGLGLPQPGNMALEVSGADQVTYTIDEQFQQANNLSYPPKTLEVRSEARLLVSSEKIPGLESLQARELSRRIRPPEPSSRQQEISRDGRTIRPGSPIYVQVIDPDRDLTNEPDKILTNLQATSGDTLDRFELIETGPHTGVFHAAVSTSIPLPRADASDTDDSSNPATMIRIDDQGLWTSRADAVKPKWIEVDTMSSAEVASASVEVPNLDQVRSVTMFGMLADQYEEIASYPARADAARGGLTLDITTGRQGEALDQIRRLLRLAPTTSQWQASPAFERKAIETHPGAGWLTTRLRGTFYLPEVRTLELKFLNQHIGHLTAYALIDGQLILGGSLRDAEHLSRTGRIELPAGHHTLELFSTHHEKASSVILGYRTNQDTYEPLPESWFSVEAHPELANILKPRGTIRFVNGKVSLALDTPQRLRKLRLVFNEFNGLSVSAGKFTITDTAGRTIVPGKEEFTQGRHNRTLEIAPGDEIAVHYTDNKRPWDGEQVLEAKLNSSYFNGSIMLANESIVTRNEHRHISYLPARRIRAGDQLAVIVTDYDLDTTAERDVLEVQARTSSGQTITLQALETSQERSDELYHRHAGQFMTVLKFGEQPGPGVLPIQPGDRVTISYLDSENTNPGVPIERTFTANESGHGSPEILIYRSSVKQVEDNSLEAQVRLRRVASSKDDKPPVVLKAQPVARHPDFIPPDVPEGPRPQGIITSVAAPLLWEVTHPRMALNQGSTLNVTLVAESELQAAKREGREPKTLTVPMRLDSVENLTKEKGYAVQVQSHVRRGSTEMLRDGVFAGIARLQIGSPGDPIDDLIISHAGNFSPPLRPDADGSEYRVPTLLVSGSDVVHIRADDPDNNTVVQTSVELRSQARLELLDNSYNVQHDAIHLGEKFSVRVTDPDQDLTDERNEVWVVVTGSSGDRINLKLVETLPHSGVFTASFEPNFIGEKVGDKLPVPKTDDDTLSVFFGEEVQFSYVDKLPLDSDTSQTLTVTGQIQLGSDAELAIFTKQFKDREIAVKTRFLMAEALFEMAKEHRKIGQTEQARDETTRGKSILEEALRDYPNTSLTVQGDYLLANLAQELGNYAEAINRYSNVVSAYPDSEYAAQSQFKKAFCYELQENYDQACEEYVKLTYIYPEHALVADATIRLGNYYYKQKSFKVAGRIFYQFHQKRPTHRLAPRALFLSAQSAYTLQEFKQAAVLFSQVIEIYTEEKELRAEAMYWLGDSQFRDNDVVRAYQTYKKLTWDYPDSHWAKTARGWLTDEEFIRAAESN